MNLYNNPLKVIEEDSQVSHKLQRLYKFKNGYGASLIRMIDKDDMFDMGDLRGNHLSYTTITDNDWEVGVLSWEDGKYKLTSETGLCSGFGVKGFVPMYEIEELLEEIKNLPPKGINKND